MVYTEPAPGQVTSPGVAAPARKVIVTGTDELLVSVYAGMLVPPLVVFNPDIVAGMDCTLHVIVAPGVWDVRATGNEFPVEQMVWFG